ncbi:MAG: c-type cytochrome [Pseudohongiellaceae bacterium]|jgi:cytochrome c553
MKDFAIPLGVTLFCTVLSTFVYSNLEIKARPRVNACFGECYAAEVAANGSMLERLRAQQAAEAAADPAQLGGKIYTSVCQSCHGDKGQGVVGPAVAGRGRDYLLEALLAYKKGETRGTQSAVMWPQAATMSQADMENVAAFIETL